MSIRELIDAFGGTYACAQVFGVTPQAVSNWALRGKVPARHHLRLVRECEAREIPLDTDLLEAA